MESLSNQSTNGNANPGAGSGIELTLLGIDKKWVRYNGVWVDKSTIPSETKTPNATSFISEEIQGSVSPWWQFWKA